MNRDEALRCLSIAKDYLHKKNDIENALKYARKSYKLDPTPQAKAYIQKCQEMLDGGNKPEAAANEAAAEEGAGRVEGIEGIEGVEGVGGEKQKRRGEGKHRGAAIESFTKEQLEDIKKIIKTKDFYEILGIPKSSTDDEVKKAYRKLALKYHPDKNKAPKADEAFKKIAQAYDCLSNPKKKRIYDQYGYEDPDQHYQHYTQFFNTENISAQEIFEMFFGRSDVFKQAKNWKAYTRGDNPGEEGEKESKKRNARRASLLQFLPLAIIFLSTFAFDFSREEPLYSLMHQHKYPYERETSNLKVKYYVNEDFNSKYGSESSKLTKIDEEIEINYMHKLRQNCENQKHVKNKFESQAQYYSGTFKSNKANMVDLSTCHLLLQIMSQYPHLSVQNQCWTLVI